jgi:CDP-diacylglycerol pyrophosphatase
MTRAAPRLLLTLILLAAVPPTVNAADPSALWHIVHDRCVPDEQQNQEPAPCTQVDVAQGYAVLKDRDGATQYLLIPTARVGGIEDQAILAPDAPNYWEDAWQARRYVEQRAGHALARDVLSLAINSTTGRTQDQLHIHIDCIRPDVRIALAQHLAEIGAQWSAFPTPLAGHHYRAMRLPGADLGSTNPFRLLAAGVKQAEMGQHTLVLAGATFATGQPGFVLLDDRADLAAGDRASGEELQDHDCALAR